MQEISLRKAHQIVKQLDDKMIELEAGIHTFTRTQVSSISDPPTKLIEELRAKISETIASFNVLNTLRFALRDRVQKANTSYRINELIGERAQIQNLQTFYGRLEYRQFAEYDEAAFVKMSNRLMESNVPATRESIYTMTKQMVADITSMKKTLRQQYVQLTEQLEEKNRVAKITITPEEIATLKANDVIF